MANDRIMPVYFVGYPGMSRRPVTSVKGRVYYAPWRDGKADIGGVLQVPESDVEELLKKNEFYIRNRGTFAAYTTNSQVAAAASRKAVKGEITPTRSELTTDDVLQGMTVEELAAILDKKRAEEGGEPDPSEPKEPKKRAGVKPEGEPQ